MNVELFKRTTIESFGLSKAFKESLYFNKSTSKGKLQVLSPTSLKLIKRIKIYLRIFSSNFFF